MNDSNIRNPKEVENRHAIVGQVLSGRRLLAEMDKMRPMLAPKRSRRASGTRRAGQERNQALTNTVIPNGFGLIFRFAISEIRKYFDGTVALCKEATSLWPAVGLDPGIASAYVNLMRRIYSAQLVWPGQVNAVWGMKRDQPEQLCQR